jgi:hypothetical protein
MRDNLEECETDCLGWVCLTQEHHYNSVSMVLH